jgi:hypothetical protein
MVAHDPPIAFCCVRNRTDGVRRRRYSRLFQPLVSIPALTDRGGLNQAVPTNRFPPTIKELVMSIGTILLIVLILILIGVLPTWPHARSWGYGPSGIAGIVVLVLIVLLVTGRL